ncbi:hypothetical protein Tco_0970695 [Tanacetum coccineum]
MKRRCRKFDQWQGQSEEEVSTSSILSASSAASSDEALTRDQEAMNGNATKEVRSKARNVRLATTKTTTR